MQIKKREQWSTFADQKFDLDRKCFYRQQVTYTYLNLHRWHGNFLQLCQFDQRAAAWKSDRSSLFPMSCHVMVCKVNICPTQIFNSTDKWRLLWTQLHYQVTCSLHLVLKWKRDQKICYCIAGNFRGRKLLQIAHFSHTKGCHASKLHKGNLWIANIKMSEFAKVSSFSLYYLYLAYSAGIIVLILKLNYRRLLNKITMLAEENYKLLSKITGMTEWNKLKYARKHWVMQKITDSVSEYTTHALTSSTVKLVPVLIFFVSRLRPPPPPGSLVPVTWPEAGYLSSLLALLRARMM